MYVYYAQNSTASYILTRFVESLSIILSKEIVVTRNQIS